MTKSPIQRAIARLKQFAGMPVPATVRWIDGKPDFRQIDVAQYARHYEHKLCAVCGTKLGLSCYWMGGNRCRESHCFIDGPMHEECATLSIKLCPFLNKTRSGYRGDDVQAMPVQEADGRPEKMYLFRGATDAYSVQKLGEKSLALWAGKQLTVVREF
jgi:hypothetical protein